MQSRMSLLAPGGGDPDMIGSAVMQRPTPESNRFAPYKRLHRKLRSYYPVLIPLALIASLVGAYSGWHRAVPVYRSEGLIHVANSLPKVMNETDQNESLGMFDEFVDSQVLLLSSRHVIALALADPKLRTVLGKRPMSVEQFVTSMTVDHPPRTQAIDVTFTDPDPDVAAQSVQAVVNAFLDIYGKSDTSEEQKRLDVLAGRRNSLQQQIAAVKKEMSTVPLPDALSIAMVDETMRDLLRQKSFLDSTSEGLHQTYGSANRDMASAQHRAAEVDDQIEKYRREFNAMQSAQLGTPPAKRHIATLPEYMPYEDRIDSLVEDLTETEKRIDVLSTEASLHSGRFTVSAAGDVPSSPYADRRIRMAAVYGLGLGMIPVAVFMLLGIADRRFHFSEDAVESAEAPLLGVLPVLPDHHQQGELARVAAYCVHKLRVRLQILNRKKERAIYMITSATAGEGKTSLTLALGMAFAASGKRTLLIDGDPVARGLTRRLHQDEQPGLLDSFEGGGLSHVQTLAHNVSVLPAGHGTEHRLDAGFGWEELEWLLNDGPTQYDVILIDTGPVLGSLQAPIVAQVVDHVIMTVAWGLKENVARQAVRLLRSIDVNVAGFVFNRATARDYNRWIGGESYYTRDSESLPQRYHNGSAPYGPLAASITASRRARVEADES